MEPSRDQSFVPEPGTLVVEDHVLAAGFIQLPKLVLHARNLSRDAKLLYAVLLSYAWQEESCFPGYARLCDEMGATEKVVRKYMRELEAVHLLSQRRRGLGLTNIYTLHALNTAQLEVPERSKTPVQERYKTPTPERSKTPGKLETEKLETEEIYPSNVRKGNPSHKKQERRDQGEGTDRAGSSGTLNSFLEEDQRPSPQTPPNGRDTRSTGFSSLGDVIAARRPKGGSEGRTAPQKTHSEERQRILADIERFARELGDEAPLPSSVSRAYNLWQRSGIPIEAFTSLMYEAKSLTWEYSHKISKTKQPKEGERNPWGPEKNRMAYCFSILEHLVDRSTTGKEDSAPELNGTAPDDRGEARQNTLPDAPESPVRPVSRARRPVRRATPSPALVAYIADLAEEFGDRANAPAYLGEALGLYTQSELPEDAFLQVLTVARTMIQGKVTGEGSMMPQFFEIVAKQLGLGEQYDTAGATG